MNQTKTYDQEFKTKLLKEYEETKSLTAVAAKNSVPVTTLHNWILKKDPKSIEQKLKNKKVQQLEKENEELQVQVKILKELLKKTNQIWLKD